MTEQKAQLTYKLLRESAQPPTRKRTSDAGFDVFACFHPSFEENNALQQDKRVWTGGKTTKTEYFLKLAPGTRGVVPTGVSVSCPEDTVFQVWPRSGLALQHGISVMAGLIDSGYRGEVCIILLNDSDKDFIVQEGMKIAQLVPVKLTVSEFEEVEGMPDSSRGSSGFGSSGLFATEKQEPHVTE